MKPKPTPNQRLVRMRRMFGEDQCVLVEDYEYFTQSLRTPEMPGQNKARNSNGGPR